jgi:hypothetical protein
VKPFIDKACKHGKAIAASGEGAYETGDRSNVAAERKLRERKGPVEGFRIITSHLACPFSWPWLLGLGLDLDESC